MITGDQEQPDDGSLLVGETVKIAYVDQSRDALDPEKSIWEEISGGMDTLDLGRAAGQFPRLCRPLWLRRQ
jgi:sulfate-transporting ATPase